MFFGIIGILINLDEFFLLEALDISAGVFVNFLDVVFGKVLFIFFDDILFDIILSIESDGSVSDTGSTAHIKDDNLYKMEMDVKYFQPEFAINCMNKM